MMNILNKLHIDNSVYLLILISYLSGYIKNVSLIMCIIIVHELGHIFFSFIFHFPIISLHIYPFGGLTVISKRLHERIYKDIIISIGGIAFQLLLSLLFLILYQKNLIVSSTYHLFTIYNQSIILFNLLPIIPLDGSKLISSILSKYLPYKSTYILTIYISIISLLLFIFYNTIHKINDIIIYIFLFIKLLEQIQNYRYIINKFYLERTLYDHYYNQIINNETSLNNIRLDKYYYFYENNRYINEKDYIQKKYFT